jgi:ABC-type multidrug transport system ATPase subunit
MSEIINVKNLTKSFKDIKAVDDLSFSVNTGEIYGFLGQNGAGKSTTIRMLLTLIEPASGLIEMFGMNLKHKRKEILKQVGAIIEKPDMYKYLTAFENLRLFALLSGIKAPKSLLLNQLEQVGLLERAHDKVKTFSQGMKQRLGIAVALVHNPQLIILDEPINGLDPQGIADIRNLILQLSKEKGKTIFISSHLLSEMQLVADSMLIIDKGKKIVEGKIDQLLNPGVAVVELVSPAAHDAVHFIQHSGWKQFFKTQIDGKIKLEMNKDKIPGFIKDLVQNNIPVTSIRPVHSLEDYFLSLTN